MSISLILYSTAVPLQNDQGRVQPRGGGGVREEILNLVVRETLQMILASPTPPNSPTAGGTFSFPAPAQEVNSRLSNPTRNEKKTTREEKKLSKDEQKTDGNDADESDTEPEDKQPVRRKRARLSSFSNSSAASRRVPHKKQCEVVVSEPVEVVTLDEPDCRVGTWKNLGTELRTIAEKFSKTGVTSSKLCNPNSNSKGSRQISKNVVTIAINIFLWKLMRRIMAWQILFFSSNHFKRHPLLCISSLRSHFVLCYRRNPPISWWTTRSLLINPQS